MDGDDHRRVGPGGGSDVGEPGLAAGFDRAVDWLGRVRDDPIVVGAALVVVAALLGGGWWLRSASARLPVDDAIPIATTSAVPDGPAVVAGDPSNGVGPGGGTDPPAPVDDGAPLVVHVAGAVRSPGIVTLDPGARVVDAVEAAGGATADADLHQLNLAAPLVDGSQIRVPREGEEAIPVPTIGGGPEAASGPVDVNRASAADLERLPRHRASPRCGHRRVEGGPRALCHARRPPRRPRYRPRQVGSTGTGGDHVSAHESVRPAGARPFCWPDRRPRLASVDERGRVVALSEVGMVALAVLCWIGARIAPPVPLVPVVIVAAMALVRRWPVVAIVALAGVAAALGHRADGLYRPVDPGVYEGRAALVTDPEPIGLGPGGWTATVRLDDGRRVEARAFGSVAAGLARLGGR